jgi:trans-aconitate 2-methyltransferase
VPGSDRYTFSDTATAAYRLDLLAELYRPSARDFLLRWCPAAVDHAVDHAVDLGSGPGHTTRLLHEVSQARLTTGVERSPQYFAHASAQAPPGIRFVAHDVTVSPLPIEPADVMYSRFLLTHLAAPERALALWAEHLVPGGRLLLQETARLVSREPAIGRYYELVAELQDHHGQALDVGSRLPEIVAAAGLTVEHAGLRRWQPPVAAMVALHVLNLRTWRHDPYAASAFDPDELDAVDAALVEIAHGLADAEPIEQDLAELVVRPTP